MVKVLNWVGPLITTSWWELDGLIAHAHVVAWELSENVQGLLGTRPGMVGAVCLELFKGGLQACDVGICSSHLIDGVDGGALAGRDRTVGERAGERFGGKQAGLVDTYGPVQIGVVKAEVVGRDETRSRQDKGFAIFGSSIGPPSKEYLWGGIGNVRKVGVVDWLHSEQCKSCVCHVGMVKEDGETSRKKC